MNATAAKERPILFSGPMVKAILDGRKAQTRRIVKLPGAGGRGPLYQVCLQDDGLWADSHCEPFACPYGKPGERLWVRETFCQKCDDNDRPVYNAEGNLDPSCFHYRADGYQVEHVDSSERSPWSPSIHMPRYASRITLEIASVRVERLQEISEADAYAEGVTIPSHQAFASNGSSELRNEARCAFQSLWESINGKGSWSANPWVWVVEFRRVENA